MGMGGCGRYPILEVDYICTTKEEKRVLVSLDVSINPVLLVSMWQGKQAVSNVALIKCVPSFFKIAYCFTS